VRGAAGCPAHGVHLDDHPAAALVTVPGRFEREGLTARVVRAVAGLAATVAAVQDGGHGHSVFWSSLTGILRSASRSRSAVAGRPSVVR
jgi:hypothetical protein